MSEIPAGVGSTGPFKTRRDFLKGSGYLAATFGFPTIVPITVFFYFVLSNRINIGAIGVGRISSGYDLLGIWKYD